MPLSVQIMPYSIRGGRLLSTLSADDLIAWQRRCGLRTDAEAASALGLSIATYRRKRTGRAKITHQTALLMAYFEIYSDRWLELSEAALRLAHLTRVPMTPPAARRVKQVAMRITDEFTEAA